MEKGLLFFTLSILCLWLILDDFYGTKKVSKLAMSLTPDVRTPIDDVKEKIEDVEENIEEGRKEKNDKAVEEGTPWGKFYEKYILGKGGLA